MAAYTTAHLLSSIDRRSFIPSNQLTYTTAEILDMADEEIKTTILPNILAVREEFFVFNKDYTIVSGQAAYDIPARGVGMAVRDVVVLMDNDGVYDLPRREPERISNVGSGNPDGFFLRGNQVVLDRTPTGNIVGRTLRVSFFLRPGDFVETNASAVISAIDTSTNVVTVSTIPSSWTTGDTFDFIKQDGGHEYIEIDQTCTDVSSTDITFSSLPSNLRVGDYISLNGESPLVQLPPDYRPVLAQCVAAAMLEGMNQPGADKALRKAEMMLEAAQKLISPRVQGEDQVVTHDNWY